MRSPFKRLIFERRHIVQMFSALSVVFYFDWAFVCYVPIRLRKFAMLIVSPGRHF